MYQKHNQTNLKKNLRRWRSGLERSLRKRKVELGVRILDPSAKCSAIGVSVIGPRRRPS